MVFLKKSTMSKIPPPAEKREIPEDHSPQYLEEWKSLFNAIPGIQAFLRGEVGFPNHFLMDPHRLDGAVDTNVQLFIKITNELSNEYGSEIYLCLRDEAFAINWVSEFDQNLDTLLEVITWEAMYARLIRGITQLQNRIPPPPTS
jgi:hypothetical protein